MRLASRVDCEILVAMMAEFYAEADYPLNRKRARTAFEQLLDDERLGRVWVMQDGAQDVGYIVMTLGYSMEYGGRDAFVDDLYVRAAHRNRGIGREALAAVRADCERLGVRAIHLEVGRDNATAQSLYRRAGFVDNDRQLLTLRLADPTHTLE